MSIRRRTLGPIGLLGAAALAVGALASGCEDGITTPADGTTRLQINLTDFPLDILESAEVWISRVYLTGGAEGRVDLFNDSDDPHHLDLLLLRDGVQADLTGMNEVEADSYGQLRLVVDSARVTLVDGITFTDGSQSKNLFVPSGAQSGIKVKLMGEDEGENGLVLEEGSTTVVLVDFNVEQNFVFQGSAQAGYHGVIFTPVLHEIAREVSEDG